VGNFKAATQPTPLPLPAAWTRLSVWLSSPGSECAHSTGQRPPPS